MILNKFLINISIVTLIAAFCLNLVKCEPKLKTLHVIFRHGEKIPHKEFHNYPTDPYGNHSFYPIASGGLTNEGKMREYKIGKMLRDRYDNFFGPLYSTDEIYARSSDFPRAQMSLQLVIAGLFPPVGEQIWNDNLSWQPTASTFEPSDKDQLFFPDTCPLYENELNKFMECDDAKRLISQHENTLKYLTEHSGKPITTPKSVYQLFTVFREESMRNLELPEWTSKVYPDPMKNITQLHFDLRSYTTKLKRLGGGMMLRKITEDMKSARIVRKSSEKCPKSFFLSGHEDNVASLSRALGTGEPKLPDYGSTIIMETLEDLEDIDDNNKSTYFVRIMLWTGVTEKLITQNIPGCSELCPLDKFLDLLEPVIPDEYESKCCVKSKKNSAHKNQSILNVQALIILSIMFIVVDI